ncbi:hypothetical protein [Streptomyces sp. NPDC087787]|uniref:hypothetical protein n=1 Tax=Streptomyces sp. NPDC087787 TaxID=3365803 RepID=UPI00382F1572
MRRPNSTDSTVCFGEPHPDTEVRAAEARVLAQRLDERAERAQAVRRMGLPLALRGTWDEAKEAAAWLGERLAEYAPRFASESDRDAARLARLVSAAAERLRSGADVSYGCYLERPSYLSLAVVTCAPNRAMPELACHARRAGSAFAPALTARISVSQPQRAPPNG